jgi:acetolactate synthase-1/2/3 large subunit
VKESDLLLVVGERLGEMTTSGYTLVQPARPAQQLIHVHPGRRNWAGYFRRTSPSTRPWGRSSPRRAHSLHRPEPWTAWAAAAREAFERALTVRQFPGPLDFGVIMTRIRERLGPDAIITHGAGNFTGWPQRHYLTGSIRRSWPP